jgi:hypothetical protein
MSLTIEQIPESLHGVLGWPFDFEIAAIPDDPLWFTTEPKVDLIPIAGEGTGGLYAIIRGTGEILFVDSEGAASIVSPSLQDLLLIFVCHPYWRDLLKFSGSGSLEQMRRTLPFARRDYFQDEPEVPSLAAQIRNELRLPDTVDMVEVLHRSVTESESKIRLFASDGWKLDSLFAKFTVDDNRNWKEAEQSGGGNSAALRASP